jgi:UBX domain-containing protein 6
MRPCQLVSKSFQGDKALVDSLQPPAEKKIEAAKILSVNGIYYTCPLSGEVIPKSDYVSHLETFLNSLEAVPSMETSVVKLNCLNTHRENREKAIEIIGKYLNNIKSNPDEEKYKKIKWNHKLFQEKVRSQKGATDFLKSIGWTEETLDGIPYLVYKGTLENIDQAMIALQTDEIPRPTLHRMPKLLSPTDGQQRVELPVSRQLFDLTRFRIFFL